MQNRTMEDRIIIRVPDGYRDRLREVAKANRRSMNSEIIRIIEKEIFDPLEMKKGEAPA